MKTFIKTISKQPALIVGVGIVMFIGYSQLKGHVEDASFENKVVKKENSVTFVNGKYKVDTSFIRNDLSKAKLIADLEKQKLEEKKTVQEVPAFLWRFLDSISTDKKFDIVSPGEEWKEGIANYGHVIIRNVWDEAKQDSVSVVSGDGAVLPNKQLVYFGMSDNIALMSYMHGGLGPHSNLIILKFDHNKVTDFWYGGMWTGDDITCKSGIIKSLKSKRQNGC